MPFYEYECQSCKFYTEVMQKITDEPLTKCPSCGKKALQKLVSAPNFRLKGGGWYETDFKGDKENKRNLHGAEKDEAPAKEESPASKTAAPAEGAKGESSKAPAAAAESKSESKASGTGRSSGARAAPSGRRTAKPPARAASGKSRPAAARSKSSKAVGRKKRR